MSKYLLGWLILTIVVWVGCSDSPTVTDSGSPDTGDHRDAGDASDASDASDAGDDAGVAVITHVCGDNLDCTEVEIAGETLASVPGEPLIWRGNGDPSLARDSVSGDVWLSYSWLSSVEVDGGVYFGGVRTHLARLAADGAGFTYVGENNGNPPALGPVSGTPGWLNQEVPSLILQPDGMWQTLWISYHRTVAGAPFEGGLNLVRSTDANPRDARPEGSLLIGTSGNHPSLGTELNLNTVAGLEDCSLFTEPALLTADGEVYLGLNCMSFGPGGRQPENERFVLLRQTTGGYEVSGTLLDHDDALSFGAERIEQVDLAYSQSGERILLIGTPISFPEGRENDLHLGCYVMEVASLASGEMRRNADGSLYVEAIITDPESQPSGTGACAYDAGSPTGLLIVRRRLPPANPSGGEFTLLQTGLHF